VFGSSIRPVLVDLILIANVFTHDRSHSVSIVYGFRHSREGAQPLSVCVIDAEGGLLVQCFICIHRLVRNES